MIRKFRYGEVSPQEIFARFNPTASVEGVVSEIIANVVKKGDAALKEYAKKFDGVDLDGLEVTQAEIDEAYENADKAFIAVLEEAAKNIREFHLQQVRQGFTITRADGSVVGQ